MGSPIKLGTARRLLLARPQFYSIPAPDARRLEVRASERWPGGPVNLFIVSIRATISRAPRGAPTNHVRPAAAAAARLQGDCKAPLLEAPGGVRPVWLRAGKTRQRAYHQD